MHELREDCLRAWAILNAAEVTGDDVPDWIVTTACVSDGPEQC